MLSRTLVLLAIASVGFACATSRNKGPSGPFANVKVNAIHLGESYGRRYVLVPGSDELQPGDIEYRQLSAYVHRTLQLRGFQQVESTQDADVVIALSYAVTDPRTHVEEKVVPVMRYVPGTRYYTDGFGTVVEPEPTRGRYVQDYEKVKETRVLFGRNLRLSAYQAGSVVAATDPSAMTEVWRLTLTSEGASNDLNQVFPLMLGVGIDYVGKNSGGPKTVKVFASASDVRKISQASPAETPTSAIAGGPPPPAPGAAGSGATTVPATGGGSSPAQLADGLTPPPLP